MTGVFFNGKLLISPTTQSMVDDSAMYNKNPNVGNLLAILGKSEGGEPFKPLRFGSAEAARAVLRSGEALKAIEKAFDPSKQTAGPATVIFFRVNPATQSALVLKDAANADSINLASQDYGRYTTNIRVKVESGSIEGKKLSTQLGNNYYTVDNLIRKALAISYSGASVVATVAVNDTTLTLTTDAGAVAIDLAVFKTIGELADRINVEPGFTAVVQDSNHAKPTLTALDTLATQDVKAAAYTITGTLQACVDWFNGLSEGFITATRATGATALPANIPYTYLAGGSDGTTLTSDWQKAFDELKKEDVQWVSAVSTDAAIHAMASTHVSFMSNVGRKERRAFCGMALGTTDAQAIAAAKALNSDRVYLSHIGIYDYDANSVLTLYPASILAALLGGMASGVNPGTALTNKSINVVGLERKLENPTDTDPLILGGVLVVEDTDEGFKVVKSCSTWRVDDKYNRVELSTGSATDYMSRAVRQALDPLRGANQSPILLSDAVSRTQTVLMKLAEAQPLGLGILVGDDKNPAFKNISASIEGDVLKVEFQASPVIPNNYILIAIHAVPWSGSTSL